MLVAPATQWRKGSREVSQCTLPYTEYTLNTHRIHTENTHNTHRKHTEYTHKIHRKGSQSRRVAVHSTIHRNHTGIYAALQVYTLNAL